MRQRCPSFLACVLCVAAACGSRTTLLDANKDVSRVGASPGGSGSGGSLASGSGNDSGPTSDGPSKTGSSSTAPSCRALGAGAPA
jgi:hypothetical protein